MQVKLEKSFPLEAPAASSWQVLSDIEAVAACMPGAEITEQVDDTHYKGKVKVKIGPATMAFEGTVELIGIDAANRELRVSSHGQDTKGTSSAQMDLVATIHDTDAGGSELKGNAEVTVNGKAASLGGRMMTQVADQVLNQFGKAFASKATAAAEGGGAEAAAGEAVKEEPQAINGLAFVWSVIIGFIKSLFTKKQTSAN